MLEQRLPAELSGVLAGGLYVEDRLAVGWRIPASMQRPHAELLRAAIALESLAAADRDEPKALGPELIRIEAKLDVLMAMLARLLHASSDPPAPAVCRFSTSGLLWCCSQELLPATELSLELYLHEMIALPIILNAKVTKVHALAGRYWIEASFIFADAETRDLLERWIFLRHRKQIAARLAKDP